MPGGERRLDSKGYTRINLDQFVPPDKNYWITKNSHTTANGNEVHFSTFSTSSLLYNMYEYYVYEEIQTEKKTARFLNLWYR